MVTTPTYATNPADQPKRTRLELNMIEAIAAQPIRALRPGTLQLTPMDDRTFICTATVAVWLTADELAGLIGG